jgi:hypothetical protein
MSLEASRRAQEESVEKSRQEMLELNMMRLSMIKEEQQQAELTRLKREKEIEEERLQRKREIEAEKRQAEEIARYLSCILLPCDSDKGKQDCRRAFAYHSTALMGEDPRSRSPLIPI